METEQKITRPKYEFESHVVSNLRVAKVNKGPVKLIKWAKIAHSFLQSASNQFHVIILSLPM